MEARVIKKFFPHLVASINDCIYSVSDQCLAQGLIADSVYKTILQSTGTNEDKARILLSSLLSVIEAHHADNSACFQILLNILSESLPPYCEGLLSAMKREHKEIPCTAANAVVPIGPQRAVPSAIELSGRCVTQHDLLFGKLEDSIRQHERARVEKIRLEQYLIFKSQEVEKLKNELGTLKCLSSSSYLISNTESRISANEAEIKELKMRMEEVECIVEDHETKLRQTQNKSKMCMEQQPKLVLVEQQAELVLDETTGIKKGARKREEEQASLVAEREEQLVIITLQKKHEDLLTLTKAKDEELRRKEQEYNTRLEEAIQKKKSEHTNVVKEQEEKHKRTLDEIEAKYQKALESRIQEVHEIIHMREMQHVMELQNKDLKIKALERRNSEHQVASPDPSRLSSLVGKNQCETKAEPKIEDKNQPSISYNVKAKKWKFKWPFKRQKSEPHDSNNSTLEVGIKTIQNQDLSRSSETLSSSPSFDSMLYNLEASQPEDDDVTLDPSLNSDVTTLITL